MFKDKSIKSKNKENRPFIRESAKSTMRFGTDSLIENPQEESRRWAVDEDERLNKTTEALENKRRFFEKDVRMEEVLPDGEEEEEEIPNRFGYFETSEGTMLVGYDKYHKRTGRMGFSLLSDDETEEKRLPENDAYDMNTYFGKNYKGEEKHFVSSALSFTYDPNTEQIQKMVDDDNNSSNDDEELLYQTTKEEANEDRIRERKSKTSAGEKKQLQKQLTVTEQIKDEKEEKNREFLKEINKFIDSFKQNKLNVFVDSEDAITRRKRIVEMSIWIIECTRLRKMLEEMDIKNMNLEEIYSLVKDKVNRLSKVDIKRIIDELKNQ